MFSNATRLEEDEEYLVYKRHKENYLINEIGPKTHDLWIAVPISILYALILIAGIVGNVLVCVVIIRNSSLHTATNYYLFNLAISDLIYLLFGLPFEVILFWHQYPYLFGSTFCGLSRMIKDTCTFVSVLTIVAFSSERFIAICYPLHVYMMGGLKRVTRIIATIWLIGIICALPFGYYTRLHYLRFPLPNGPEISESALCKTQENTSIPVWELSAIIFYVIPLILLIFTYSRMAIEIRKRIKNGHELGVITNNFNCVGTTVNGNGGIGTKNGSTKRTKSCRAVVKMLVVVVITFFICWSPYHIQHLLTPHLREIQDVDTAVLINTVLFLVSGIFYYTSCTINPIIYNVMSHRYRAAFRETLCGKRHNLSKRLHYNGNSFRRNEQRSVKSNGSDGAKEHDVNQHLMRKRSKRRSSSTYSKMTVLNDADLNQ